ncbi:MAG: alkaline phosphatase family protein [Clostridiales bacterium]|nr:alkaline phosphatase family protein [Clostridiales bacterium]
MAEHFNHFPLRHFAGIVADCMDIALPESFAPGIPWVSDILKARLGGPADRAVLYHADAVGQYIWQQYTDLFAPVYMHTSMAVPFLSTVLSVTPVAHASMYTGLDPDGHGIHTYVRPRLSCETLYDVLLALGRKVAIVAQQDSTFLHIFAGREMDYFECANAVEVQQQSLRLIESDRYDLISIHTFDYDNAAHAYGPESKEGLNAIALEAAGFHRLAEALEKTRGRHRTLLTYSPDHGQHTIPGGRGAHGDTSNEDMNILHFFGTIA